MSISNINPCDALESKFFNTETVDENHLSELGYPIIHRPDSY